MKNTENDWIRVSMLLTKQQAKKLDKIGKSMGVTRSVTIRIIIDEWMAKK